MSIDEKIQSLYAKFPLCFPVPPYCGFEIGNGWFEIIEELCSKIEQVLSKYAKDEHKFQVAQVKEKFGGLRFYVEYCVNVINQQDIELIESYIIAAETKSYKTCEKCGNLGTLRKSGWHRTLCDECENKRFTEHNPWK